MNGGGGGYGRQRETWPVCILHGLRKAAAGVRSSRDMEGFTPRGVCPPLLGMRHGDSWVPTYLPTYLSNSRVCMIGKFHGISGIYFL